MYVKRETIWDVKIMQTKKGYTVLRDIKSYANTQT